ncbi:helix-turn-helix domain-containing protein [Streptomyces sp. V4I23]|uniref:helix-turn-helix domain-containing protein n=1 Tax=Streptomyces sp. V4I23 TaxID=3042282 RepID=UPI0027D77199|nr:helix-turn-helix domain-containing protein [Streptomyces sp. V4I23]
MGRHRSGRDDDGGGVRYARDARKLSADGLEDLRRCAVAAVESGLPRTEVARMYGVSRQTVGAWVSTYRLKGADALRPRRRGRRPGDRLALSPAQQLWALRTVTASTPEQVGLRHALWTSRSVAELVDRQFHVGLRTPTIRNYLMRWGVRAAGPPTARPGVPRAAAGGPAPSGLVVVGSPRPGDSSETLWTECARIRWSVPAQAAADGVTPGASHDSDLLIAVSDRGALLFMASRDPYDGAEISDFFERLVRQRGRRVVIAPGWRPIRRPDLLAEWITAHTEPLPGRGAVTGVSTTKAAAPFRSGGPSKTPTALRARGPRRSPGSRTGPG